MDHFKSKSYLAPQGDRFSTYIFEFLIFNLPVVAIFNDYKSDLKSLSKFRTLVSSHNGFAYQPTRYVKIRSFKGLKTGFSSLSVNGLVILTFFKNFNDYRCFFQDFNSFRSGFNSLSFFSIIIDGHLANTSTKSIESINLNSNFITNSFLSNSVGKILNFKFLILKINVILNAYIKSTN